MAGRARPEGPLAEQRRLADLPALVGRLAGHFGNGRFLGLLTLHERPSDGVFRVGPPAGLRKLDHRFKRPHGPTHRRLEQHHIHDKPLQLAHGAGGGGKRLGKV